MNYAIHVSELTNMHEERNRMRLAVFEQILKKCYQKIYGAAKQDQCFSVFAIPDFILGTPLYNIKYCTVYLMAKLKENGYNVQYMFPNMLYISWKYPEPIKTIQESIKNAPPPRLMLMPPPSRSI